jgi:hypothetical protein
LHTGFVRAFVLTAIAVLAGACAQAVDIPPARSPSVTASAERDLVRVTLALEGPPVSRSRTWADARVENLGQRAVVWTAPCRIPVSITIDLRSAFASGRQWAGRIGRFKSEALGGDGFENPVAGSYVEESLLRRAADGPVVCPVGGQATPLEPGGVLVVRAGWDGLIAGGHAAPPGTAVVTASFPFVGSAGAVEDDVLKTRPIEVAMETIVEAGSGAQQPPLAPGLAIDAAVADPQFFAWVESTADSSWVNPSLVSRDGAWAVGLFRTGSVPGATVYGEVTVDAEGRVVGRRFDPLE